MSSEPAPPHKPDDLVSAAVRQQYEEHPYPFWRGELPDVAVNDLERDVLVAGCGSGYEILVDAKSSPRSRYLGIDLSMASLSLSAQRAAEFRIANVRLRQMNILDVRELGETFDFIKSTGVLHHMEKPFDGLLSLKSVLRPGGTIKFSVYSKSGRRAALAAIELRKQMGVPATGEAIRAFRDHLRALPNDHPAKGVIYSPDFHSVAGARDLLFNVIEHNFTVPELAAMVKAAELEIISWGPSKPIRKLQEMGYPDTLDWRIWHEAEVRHPALFSNGMYSLTVKAK